MAPAIVIQLEGYRDKEVITPRLENDINPCSGGRNHHNLHEFVKESNINAIRMRYNQVGGRKDQITKSSKRIHI